ncbi:MAG TPA: hypothetical protein VKR55_25815 [Bradyrhizobium sp.]|uniref:hypothetical protein n=1 Tax=Bradyrhizobium sp. TaxID=376 RepID=UPI002C45EA5B|nr:hypothetical protein [Bradyrhizobium sp.]HLZ05555.1 hypothetical protein [Bradyrhizobium sp.]
MNYFLVIRGSKSPGTKIALFCDDKQQARKESLAIFTDLSRGIFSELAPDDHYQLDLVDHAEKPIFGLRIWAMSFGDEVK